MDGSVTTHTFSRKAFFTDAFPFAIRRLSNRAGDFNLSKRFHRQFWKIAYIVKGSGNYVIGEQKLPFSEGSLIVTHPDAETTWDIHGDELQLFNLVFDRSFLSERITGVSDNHHFLCIFSSEYSTEYESPMFLLTADREIDLLIRSIYREFEDCRPNREPLIQLRFQELILLILRRCENKHRRNPNWTAHYVLSYLQHHFSEEISLRDLAQTVQLSQERLCRLFRERCGCSIMAKQRELRIAEAQKLLAATALSCGEIARRTGFRTPSYFHRCFSAECGMTPEIFRKMIAQN